MPVPETKNIALPPTVTKCINLTPINTIPPFQTLNDLSKREGTFIGEHVFVSEKLDGIQIKIKFSPGKAQTIPRITDQSKKSTIIGLLNKFGKENKRSLLKLSHDLYNIEFVLFGVLINNKLSNHIKYFKDDEKYAIYFFDIFINSRWFNYDDLAKILAKYQFNIIPEIYSGVYDNTIYGLVNVASKISSDCPVYGIVVRSIPECDYWNVLRPIAKVDNESFTKIIDTEKKTIFSVVEEEVIGPYLKNEARIWLWEFLLEKQNIDYNSQNPDQRKKALSAIVADAVNVLNEDFIKVCNKHSFSKKTVVKAFKKLLPKHIIKYLFDKKGEKTNAG